MAATNAPPEPRSRVPRIRRFITRDRGLTRSPLANTLIALGVIAILIFLAARLFLGGPGEVTTDVIDFSKTLEQVAELSTVKSHIHFAVVVREEGGNIIVRHLADQAEGIEMDGLGTALFQDPTMIIELHGVATYGVKLGGLADRITQNDSVVTIPSPPAELLDVKLVAADTRVVAQMKGLFRSANTTLLATAAQRGEEFVREYALQDTTLTNVAAERARGILGMIVERSGKRVVFE